MIGVNLLTASIFGGCLASVLVAGGMLVSAVWSERRFWPPGRYDWRWWTYLGLSGTATCGLVLAGVLDWNSWVLPRPESLVLGLVLLVFGGAGFIVATVDLGFEESSGKEGDLRTDGFYRYTRNPQILFLFVILIGSVGFSNSVAVLLVATAMCIWFALMPFAEESWLKERFGDKFERYCESTPRFIDARSVRRLRREIRRANENGH